MNQNNTIFDLIQRITDLLQNGRLEVVYNVAKKPELSPRLRDTFIKLAGFVEKKNDLIDQAAKVNTFYRECIEKIIDYEEFGEDSLSNEYQYIPKDTLKNVIRLKDFISKIFHQQHDQLEKVKKAQLDYQNYLVQAHEKNQLLNQYELQIQVMKKQKTELEVGLKQLKKLQQENKQITGDLKVSKEMVSQLRQQTLKLSQIIKRKEEQQRRKAHLEQQLIESQSRILWLQQNEREMEDLREKLGKQINQTKQLKEQLSLKSNLINQLREQVNSKSKQLKMVEEQSKNKLLSVQQQSKIANFESNIFASIFQKSNNQYRLADQITDRIEKLKNKSINGIERLYAFKQHKRQSFHQCIDGRFNILLVCLTEDGSLVGGFTSASFSIEDEPNDTKAFLFAMKDGQYSFNQLKRGKASIEYDLDFLIFGNEQLCLERGKCQVSSYSSALDSSQRNYQFPPKENCFQKLMGPEGRIALKNYQIFQINVDQ